MPLAKRERSFPLLRHGIAAAGLGLLLGFLGPFRTNPAFDRSERYAFWLGLTLTGYLFGFAAWKSLGLSPPLARLSSAARGILAALLSSLPQTFVVFWAMVFLQPGRAASLGGLLLLFFAVAVVQLLLVTAIVMVDRPLRSSFTEGEAKPPAERAPLADAQLIALEAQDHYVRVHGPAGSRLVLQRLSDAIAEVSDVEGLQVHRGWWVASAAVAGTFVRNDKRWVRLVNGMTIPVSRARRREVLAQGWPNL